MVHSFIQLLFHSRELATKPFEQAYRSAPFKCGGFWLVRAATVFAWRDSLRGLGFVQA